MAQPLLRLRVDGTEPVRTPAKGEALGADDARWALASATRARMSGPVLRPSDRGALMRMGRTMGLDAFACNLVIAVVQDAARRGEGLDEAAGRLAMVPAAKSPREESGLAVAAWVAAVLALEAGLLVLALT